MSAFTDDMLPPGRATRLNQGCIGYKFLLDASNRFVCARVMIPKDAVVYRPSDERELAITDLRCNMYTIKDIRSFDDATPIRYGCAPYRLIWYEVGNTYQAPEFDGETNEAYCPGLHFYATRDAVDKFVPRSTNHVTLYKNGGTAIPFILDNQLCPKRDIFIKAAKGGYHEIMQMVLARDPSKSEIAEICADPNISNNSDALNALALYRYGKGKPGSGHVMYDVCYDGIIQLVQYLVFKPGFRDANKGLEGACAGGHLEVAQTMIRCYATDYNQGLTAACTNNHPDLQREMVKHGATKCSACDRSIEAHGQV